MDVGPKGMIYILLQPMGARPVEKGACPLFSTYGRLPPEQGITLEHVELTLPALNSLLSL